MEQSSTLARPALRPSGKLAIALGGVLPGVTSGTISVMLPGISDAFGDGSNSLYIKMVATAAGLGMMIGAPAGGWLSDRFGRVSVLTVATLLFGIIGCSLSLSTALWQLILGRFLVGLVSGAIATGYIALIGDHFAGSSQSKWLSINGAVATFAVVLLNPIAGALADLGWREAFLIYATGVPVVLLVVLGLRDTAGNQGSRHSEGGGVARGGMPMAALLLAVVAGTLATGTSLYWPFRLREVGVESARDIAFYALPNVFLIGAAAFSYGLVRRRLSIEAVFMLCGLFSALGLTVMATGSSPLWVAAGLLLEGFAVGLITPNLSQYTIILSPPHRRAAMIGLVKGVYFGSPFLTQFVLEWINGRAGVPAALLAIAAMALLLAAVMAVSLVRGRLERRELAAIFEGKNRS